MDVAVEAADTDTSSAGERVAEFHVEGVSCASCDLGLRRALKGVDGVLEVTPGDEKTHVLVRFDERRATLQQLIDAVYEAGYVAEALLRA